MSQEHPTSLIAKKGNITFEMWVEIDGRPLEVYTEEELMEGGAEAWIASEDGKVRLLTDQRHVKLTQRWDSSWLSSVRCTAICHVCTLELGSSRKSVTPSPFLDR